MKPFYKSNLFSGISFFFQVCMPVSLMIAYGVAHAKACEKPAQLKLSIIPQGGVHQDISSLQPLIEALENELKIPVAVVGSNSYGAVKEGLLSGSVDLARLGPASYVTAKNADPRITAFASYARKADIFGQESAAYYSLLIVRSTSPYSDLRQLRGQKIALVDPDSTSGAVIPRYMLQRKMNIKFGKHFGRIVYTGSHDNSMKALMNNDVPAAFISSSHLSDWVKLGKIRLKDIRILWRSTLIPRDPFVYRGQLCKSIRQKISAVFLKQDG